jgi:excisionase family DNA binding protein
MLTVPEAARRTGKNPETIRRWIREGRLRAHKVGTQHVIEESDLTAVTEESDTLPVPVGWQTMMDGRPMPDVVAALRRSRAGH